MHTNRQTKASSPMLEPSRGWGRYTKGTAMRMSVDTSTIYIRSQSTLSHPLYTHTNRHTHGVLWGVCLPAFISLMAVELDLMILIFFYMQPINLGAHSNFTFLAVQLLKWWWSKPNFRWAQILLTHASCKWTCFQCIKCGFFLRCIPFWLLFVFCKLS